MLFFLIRMIYGAVRYYIILAALLCFLAVAVLMPLEIAGVPIEHREDIAKIGVAVLLVLPFVLGLFFWFTGLWEWYMRINLGCRDLLKAERERVMPLWDEVMLRAKKVSKKRLDKVQLFFVDDLSVNAFALGKKTIALTSGLIEKGSDAEIKAVLAHECGHLVHGDTRKSGAAFSVDSNSVITERGILLFLLLTRIPFVGFIFSLVLLPYIVVKYLLRISDTVVLWLEKLVSRKQEFAADKFAHLLGYRDGLYSLLDRIRRGQGATQGFFAQLVETHPEPAIRQLRLEKYQEVEEDMLDSLKPLLDLSSIEGEARS